MASAPKPPRSRKLPSPRNKELPANSGGLSSKYFSSQETHNEIENSGALDLLGGYSNFLQSFQNDQRLYLLYVNTCKFYTLN